jgi:hypothetical protein
LVADRQLPLPTHIKLDVDGIEPLILAGASETLSSTKLKSVMVEVDESNGGLTADVVRLFADNGFQEPITRHSPYFDKNHYLPVANYLFRK